MHIQKIFSVIASLGLLISLAGASPRSSDELLKSSEHKSLAKGVAAYWQAKLEKKKINESFVKLSETIDKAKKRLKGGEDILSCIDDWKQVFWIATRTGLTEAGKAKNKVSSWPQSGTRFPAFTYVVPKKHSAKGDPYPLVLIIADEGEDATEHLETKWADPSLREKYILAVVEMKSAAETSDGKVKKGAEGEPIPVDQWDKEAAVFSVLFTFGNLTRSDAFAIDYDRVFLAGSGQGFKVAATAAQWFPHHFAGLVGRGELPKDLFSANLGNVATMVAGDSEGGKQFAEGTAKLEQTETKLGADSDVEIAAWLKDQVRNAYPSKLKFKFPSNSTLDCYWLKAAGIDANAEEGARLEAEVDRATNTITIQAVQVGSLTISYNDILVDLDKPVKVIINGKTTEEKLARNQRLLIESVYSLRDWGNLKTAQGTYPVTQLAKD